jgi:hypothetical protein
MNIPDVDILQKIIDLPVRKEGEQDCKSHECGTMPIMDQHTGQAKHNYAKQQSKHQ